MTDTLDWVQWIRSVWEAKTHLRDAEDRILSDKEFNEILDGVEFFNLWMGDVIHVGRVYDAD